MTDRPHSTAPSAEAPDASQAFANLGAASIGLFQDWLKAAGSAMPNLPGAAAGGPASQAMGTMGAWTLPTLDPQELDKRIQDLRTVQFWLEQNARMIAMTIQGLEVQKMTLDTLKGMNVSMDQLRETLKAQADTLPASSAPAGAESAEDTVGEQTGDAPAPAGAELINPMRWWDTLTQQFTQMAAQAAQATQQATQQAEAAATRRPEGVGNPSTSTARSARPASGSAARKRATPTSASARARKPGNAR
jgi:hypothetical protein